MAKEKSSDNWEINSTSRWLRFPVGSIWQHRDLLLRLVRRDFLTSYQQTIVGPFWIILQPILITLIYIVVFGSVLKISTGNAPSLLFYLSGIILWNYFSESMMVISNSFNAFSFIFSKVYFPRLIVPFSYLLSALIRFVMQLILFCFIYCFYLLRNEVALNWNIIIIPFLIFLISMLSFGIGLVFASLTSKYRDLQNLLGFILRVWMFVSPVIFPLSVVPKKFQKIILFNPISPIIEYFRYACWGSGYHQAEGLLYSLIFTMVILLLGIFLFNRREGLVMDTI